MSDQDENDITTETLAETANYAAWVSEEPDGETAYHVELGAVTLHYFQEEWAELMQLMQEARKATNG